MLLVRWLDVILVVATLPFVLLAGLPALGYGVGAAAWIAQRGLGVALENRAHASGDLKKFTGVLLASTLGRAWLMALTILVVGLAGDREDGLTAAILVLCAFTVYFVISLVLRPFEQRKVGSS
jgi:hypothetical protein